MMGYADDKLGLAYNMLLPGCYKDIRKGDFLTLQKREHSVVLRYWSDSLWQWLDCDVATVPEVRDGSFIRKFNKRRDDLIARGRTLGEPTRSLTK